MPLHYNALPSDTIVRQEDGTPFPVTVNPQFGGTVHKGQTSTLAVSLPVKPSQNVTVVSQVVWQSDSGLTISGGSSLTFTPANYNTPQNVTLSFASGNDSHGLVKVSASGPDFPGFAPAYAYVDLVG